MEFLQKTIPFFIILEYLAIGFFFFLVVNFFGRYIIPLIEKRTDLLTPWWTKIRIVIWLVFFVLFFTDLFRLYPLVTVITAVVVLGLGWEYWRNMFSGILFRFTDQFKEGDFIETDAIRATVRRIYLIRTELINENGELVIVPNFRLRTGVITLLNTENEANITVFRVPASNSPTHEDMRFLALNCPYLTSNQSISVERQKDEYVIKATIIDKSFTENARNYFDAISGSELSV